MSKPVIEHIVKSIVADQQAVSIEQDLLDGALTMKIFVAESDLGRVIGKSGRTIRALRSMAQILCDQDSCRITVEAQPAS